MKKQVRFTLGLFLLMAGVAQAVVVDLDLTAAGDYSSPTVVTTSTSFNSATFDINYTIGAIAGGPNPFVSSTGAQVGVGFDGDANEMHHITLEGNDDEGLSFTNLAISNFNANGSGLTESDFDDLTFTGLTLNNVGNGNDGANVSFSGFGVSTANVGLSGLPTGEVPHTIDLTGLSNFGSPETGLYIEPNSNQSNNRWAVVGLQVEHSIEPEPPAPPTRFERVDLDSSDNSVFNGSFEDITVESGAAGENAWIAGSNSNCTTCQSSIYTVHQWAPFFSDPNDVIGRYGANGTITNDSWYTGITSNNNAGEGTFDGERGIKIDSADHYQNGLVNEDFLSTLDPQFINPNALYKLTVELTRRNDLLGGDATGTATVSVTDSAVDPTNSDHAIPGGQISGIISDLPLGTTQFEFELSGADLANASQLNLVIEATNFQVIGPDENPLGRDRNYTASIIVDNFKLTGYLPGDSDGDFDVDNDDFAAWEAGFGTIRADNTTSFALGDFDIDGEVDDDDFLVWEMNFTGALAETSEAAVPEPSSFVLLIGLVMFFAKVGDLSGRN